MHGWFSGAESNASLHSLGVLIYQDVCKQKMGDGMFWQLSIGFLFVPINGDSIFCVLFFPLKK